MKRSFALSSRDYEYLCLHACCSLKELDEELPKALRDLLDTGKEPLGAEIFFDIWSVDLLVFGMRFKVDFRIERGETLNMLSVEAVRRERTLILKT